jgi:hypothetical protein
MPSLNKEYPITAVQPLNKENIMKLHELYMKSSSWIRDMSAPRAPRLRDHGNRAAGSGK